MLGEAVTHGHADLGIVVLTSSERVHTWEWSKWLPAASIISSLVFASQGLRPAPVLFDTIAPFILPVSKR